MTLRNTCLSSRGQLTVALTFGVYLIMANRGHFNQMLVNTSTAGSSRMLSTTNVLFQLAYAVVQVPAGLYADRVSPVSVLATVALGLAITSAVAPFVLPGHTPAPFAWSTSAVATATLMAVNGVLVGSWWPFMNVMLSNWAPPEKLAYMYAVIYTGLPGGIMLGNAFTGLFYAICSSVFRYSFFVVSMVCMLWGVMWLCIFHSNPSNDPGIEEKELEYLSSSILPKTKLPVPWFKIVTSLPVWCVLFANFGSTVFYTVLVMYMPVYLKDIMKEDITQNGFMSALPSLGQILITYLAGYYGSYIQKKNWMSVTKIRKVFTFVGMTIPACIILIATIFLNSYNIIFYSMLVVAYAFSGFVFSGFRVSQIEISSNFAATITALCDLSGSLAMGTVHIVFLEGLIGTTEETITWVRICWILSFNLIAFSLPFICYGDSGIQPWNTVINT